MKKREPKERHLSAEEVLDIIDGSGMHPEHLTRCERCSKDVAQLRSTLAALKSEWNPPPIILPTRVEILAAVSKAARVPARASSIGGFLTVTAGWIFLLLVASLMAMAADSCQLTVLQGIAFAYRGFGVAGLIMLSVVMFSILSSPIIVLLKNPQLKGRSLYQ